MLWVRRIPVSLCLFSLFLTFSAVGRLLAWQSPTPQGTSTIAAGYDNGPSLSVQIRDQNGAPLKEMVVVTLYYFTGQPIATVTAVGSRATFTRVLPGSYVVEIDAPGFEKVRAEAHVSSTGGEQVMFLMLQPVSPESAGRVSMGGPILTPKAQKELSKGMDALRASRFDEARKHLESASRMAPSHPDVIYMLGSLSAQTGDFVKARTYWDKALSLDPKHMFSLLAIADSLMQQGDLAGAEQSVRKALDVDPNSWRAHSVLASVLLRQHSIDEAIAHAERALELGKDLANGSRLILSVAFAQQGQKEHAVSMLETFLNGNPKPTGTQAEFGRNLLDKLKQPTTVSYTPAQPASAVASGGAVPYLPIPVAALPLLPGSLRWLPADVDEKLPPIEAGVSCSLPEVISGAGRQLESLPHNLDRFTATEVVQDETVGDTGFVVKGQSYSFDYVASIQEVRPGALNVEEYRDGNLSTSMSLDTITTRGLPALVLVFHPFYVPDFEMKCEGLSRWRGKFAWQVYFRQKIDKPSRIRTNRASGHVWPVPLKGRAWIDATTMQILRLETDLREPMPEIQLWAEHQEIEYVSVRFRNSSEELWLPASADYYAQLGSHRIHRKHSFRDYLLFSVEDKQHISPPKTGKANDSSKSTETSPQ